MQRFVALLFLIKREKTFFQLVMKSLLYKIICFFKRLAGYVFNSFFSYLQAGFCGFCRSDVIFFLAGVPGQRQVVAGCQ